jgi:hypothetical protein
MEPDAAESLTDIPPCLVHPAMRSSQCIVLAVPGCPNVMLLEERLAAAGGNGYLAGAESSAAIRSSAAGTSQ